MRYLSVCSGIDAASVAWAPLGWEAVAFSEIERFPSEVLAHHYPHVPNWGDMEGFHDWPESTVDLLIGGTPCQSFSVAGLRGGLADPRGNLALTYLAIAERYRPEWLVWENVPGVLSADGGRAMGALLGGLAKLGYGFAYRVLDAQYVRVDGYGRAVPQRRRRVFVVGCAGDWRRAAAVLFDAESLRGNPAPRRESRKTVAPTISARPTGDGGLGTDFDCDGRLIPGASPALKARDYKGPSSDGDGDGAPLIPRTSHALTGEEFDASEDGTGRGTPLIPFDTTQITSKTNRSNPQPGDPCHPLSAEGHAPAVMTLAIRGRDGAPTLEAREDGTANAILTPNGGRAGIGVGAIAVPQPEASMAVRRLTPTECERLQGFPDGYTAIPRKGKTAADGPRYKALGNSMAVNVIRWLGRRIELVEALTKKEAA